MLITAAVLFFFQAEDGIRDLVRSRGLGDVYKRQAHDLAIDYVRNIVGFGVDQHAARFEKVTLKPLHLSLIHI